MKTFKEKIEEFEDMIGEKIDPNGYDYDVHMSALQSLFSKWGNFGRNYKDTEHAVGKDNGRELMDDCKLMISIVKKLRRG